MRKCWFLWHCIRVLWF